MIPVPDFGRLLVFRPGAVMKGRDVLAVERTLRQRGFRPQAPGFEYGSHAHDNVLAFQRHVGLFRDGQYGSDTHRGLSPLFDDYSRWLYSHPDLPHPMRAADLPAGGGDAQRDVGHLMHNLWGFYAMRPWNYHAVRPFTLYRSGEHVDKAFDCSWLVTEVYFAAGLPDPNGFDYHGGAGSTESLRVKGQRVSTAKPGDLIFYGTFGDELDPAHVVMASGNDKCIGFGSTGGPRLLPVDFRPVKDIRRYV